MSRKKTLLDELGSERALSRRGIIKAGFGLLATTIIGSALRVDAQAEENAMLESLLAFNREERSEEHTSELQSRGHLVCRLLLEKKKHNPTAPHLLTHKHI